MNKKIHIPGLPLTLAAVCLVVGTFIALDRAGYQSIYLNDTKSNHNGWEYEIRRDSGKVEKAVPQHQDEYQYTLSDGNYNAVKVSRIMTEKMTDAYLEMNYIQCGIEVFLDDCLLYSDFQTVRRDTHGYLLIDKADNREGGDDNRSIALSLPEDYVGRRLTITTYFTEDAEYRDAVVPLLQNPDSVISTAFAGTFVQMLRLVFYGGMVLGMAVCCLFPMPDYVLRFKVVILFFMYAASFIVLTCRSVIGYYSGVWEWADGIFMKIPVSMETLELFLLTVCAAVLLAAEIWTGRKRRKKELLVQMIFFGIMAFGLTALENVSELGGGIRSYVTTILLSTGCKNYVPAVKLCSSLIIYTVTFLTVTQFGLWRAQEWKKKSILLEHSRFARENYELVMQVDEDSRRRNHEMRHHMETLHSMLTSGETGKAAEYLEKTMGEAERFGKTTYSGNIVINSIVGIRLNQAKEKGIDVRCHIHVPEKMEADDVDLSILLSNMLENAVEACMRMEDRENAYIRLEIRKKQKFLFIECENSTDDKAVLKDGQTTVKDDRENHGFGLDAMRAVAEKYASIIQMEQERGRFTVRTNLCLRE